MTTKTKPPRPLRSGWCGAGNHDRRAGASGGHECPCPCHYGLDEAALAQLEKTDPEVWAAAQRQNRALEERVADTLDRLNHDQAHRDMPYRAVLLRMAREVIAVVRGADT